MKNVKLNTYSIILIAVSIVQLLFCIAICCWSKIQLEAANKKKAKDEERFYEFLFIFHQKMGEQEEAMGNYYRDNMGDNMGPTPGRA